MSKASSFGSFLARVTSGGGEGDLFAQTLRMVALLVVACVLFVGALSTAAVVITNKAFGSAGADTPASGTSDTRTAAASKKPTSI